jgi:predicted PurR-regulated permease PerM
MATNNRMTQNGRLIISKRMALNLLIGAASIWVAFLYRPALSSLVLGALLAYLLIPSAKFLADKLPINYTAAAWIVFLGCLLSILYLIRLSAPILARQVETLTSDMQLISEELIRVQPTLENILNTSIPMKEIIFELEAQTNQVLKPNQLFMILRSATANSVWVLVTIMTCFYLLLDHDKFLAWLEVITPQSMKASFARILAEINDIWKKYLRGQLLMMLIIGVLSGIAGTVVGLKNALIIGLIAGLLEMIPSLGPTISTLIAGVTAWTQGSSYLGISNFWFALLVCGLFILIQAVENTILIPRIMGRRMGLHPALVFIATISTLTLFGVIAGLIVVPVIASLGVLINHSFLQLNQKES